MSYIKKKCKNPRSRSGFGAKGDLGTTMSAITVADYFRGLFFQPLLLFIDVFLCY